MYSASMCGIENDARASLAFQSAPSFLLNLMCARADIYRVFDCLYIYLRILYYQSWMDVCVYT